MELHSTAAGAVLLGSPMGGRGFEADGDQPKANRRKSDPLPPLASSPSTSSKAALPRKSAGGIPNQMRHESWEYPLSREEKKHRVICLFEQELAEARARGCKTESNDSKALPPACSEPSDAGPQPVLERGASDAAATSLAPVAAAAQPSAAAAGPVTPFLAFTLVGLAAAAIACAVAMLSAEATSQLADPARSPTVTRAGGLGAAPSAFTFREAAAASPPNTTAAVVSMREQGLHYLRISDCWQAEWFFRSAMKQLEEDEEMLSGADGVIQNTELAAFFDEKRTLLTGDRGFALVCAQRFPEGARLLENRVLSEGYLRSPPHLVNALGYARYRMREYKEAGEVFDRAVKADPGNPILWNNLAAARMVGGDIQAADDALYHTFDHVHGQGLEFNVEEYHLQVFHSNVQNLVSRVGGQKAGLPSIELWWPG